MKALVLGAGGQVGRALCAIAPRSAEVIALTRSQCDVRLSNQVRRAIADARPDVVLNAAAYTAVDRAESEPAEAEKLNAIAPGHIVAAARAMGARSVHISTDYVFDGTANRPYGPEDPPNPSSVYGRTKLAGEQSVIAADPSALIIRTSWVYAAQGRNFVNTMLRLMREREKISVVADEVGTPTRAESLAAAIWGLICNNSGGLLHYRDSGTATWYDFALAIEQESRAMGLLQKAVRIEPIASSEYPTLARRPSYSVLDATRAWKIIGVEPPHWRANLRATLEEVESDV